MGVRHKAPSSEASKLYGAAAKRSDDGRAPKHPSSPTRRRAKRASFMAPRRSEAKTGVPQTTPTPPRAAERSEQALWRRDEAIRRRRACSHHLHTPHAPPSKAPTPGSPPLLLTRRTPASSELGRSFGTLGTGRPTKWTLPENLTGRPNLSWPKASPEYPSMPVKSCN